MTAEIHFDFSEVRRKSKVVAQGPAPRSGRDGAAAAADDDDDAGDEDDDAETAGTAETAVSSSGGARAVPALLLAEGAREGVTKTLAFILEVLDYTNKYFGVVGGVFRTDRTDLFTNQKSTAASRSLLALPYSTVALPRTVPVDGIAREIELYKHLTVTVSKLWEQ